MSTEPTSPSPSTATSIRISPRRSSGVADRRTITIPAASHSTSCEMWRSVSGPALV